MFYSGPKPVETYTLPPELGGSIANYPKLYWYNLAMFGEVRAAYAQGAALAVGYHQPLNSYLGDVVTVQLTARPGYYVSPEVMAELGWEDGEVPPNA